MHSIVPTSYGLPRLSISVVLSEEITEPSNSYYSVVGFKKWHLSFNLSTSQLNPAGKGNENFVVTYLFAIGISSPVPGLVTEISKLPETYLLAPFILLNLPLFIIAVETLTVV